MNIYVIKSLNIYMNTKKEKVYCKVCGKYIGERYKSRKCYKKTCSKECNHILISQNTAGENNGHYKNGVTIYGKKCPKCGRPISLGAKLFCMKCTPKKSFSGKKHTEKNLQIISKRSREKWTNDFKENFLQTMISRGHWIDPCTKSDYEIYFTESDWIESMFNIPDLEGISFLKEYKIFHNKTNTRGCIRDHKFSRKSGFEQKVFPEILRHPCNCRIILHGENVKKRNNDIGFGLDNIISLETLFYNIKQYNGAWKENNLCLDLIQKYERGERWKRI